VEQLEDSAAAVANLRFSDAELDEIDRHAVEAGIDLWRPQSRLT
jgi:L-glyceraldehyde 3-phosphate reductase